MSCLLAIETSSEACSIALERDGEIVCREFHEPRRHAELLLPAIDSILAEGGVSLSALDAIAFGRGPGSFTSLRIGIGVVQGLSWGAELGVVPVSSLAALALAAIERHGASDGGSVVTAVDARMGEVFHATFSFDQAGMLRVQGEEQVSAPGDLSLPANAMSIGAGNGFQRYPELERMADSFSAVYADLWPSAIQVIRIAKAWLENNDPLPAHRAQPVYVRDKVADKPPQVASRT